jgi:hypothetical protein
MRKDRLLGFVGFFGFLGFPSFYNIFFFPNPSR